VAVVLIEGGPASAVMGAALCALGVGSFLYHGLKTLWANELDVAGMYVTFGALATHALAPAHPATAWLMALSGSLLAVLFVYVLPPVKLEVQMGMLLYFTALPAILTGASALAWTSLGLFVLGYLAWHLDRARAPFIGLWGHALWHLLTAAAIALMYLAS